MEVNEDFLKLSFVQRLLWRVGVGVLGFLAATVFLFLLFYAISFLADLIGATRVRYRVPLFAFFLPIFGFIVGWRLAAIVQPLVFLLYRYSLFFRIFLFGSLFYMTSLCVFIELFEPGVFWNGLDFGRFKWYEFSGRYGDFVKLLIFPPTLLGFGLLSFNKMKPKDKT